MEPIIDKRPSRLEELFLDELKVPYGAERHQLNVLPLLKHAASSQKLQNVFSSHLDNTREAENVIAATAPRSAPAPEFRLGRLRGNGTGDGYGG
jgi:hypothetical protein